MGIRTIPIVSAALLLCAAGSASAQVTPTPVSMMFADTGTGSQSAPQTLTLTNNGNAAASITSLTLVGANPTEFLLQNIVPPPPVSLGPGATMTADVVFAPMTINQKMATVEAVVKNVGNVDVPVSGKGIGPTCSVNPSPITVGGLLFGMAQPPKMVTIANSGGAQLHVTSVTITGPDAARFTISGLPGLPKTLNAAQSFPITITFNPTQKGKANATLNVVSDDPMNPTLATTIAGLAGDPQVALDIGTLIFGNERVGQMGATQDVNLTNSGFSDLHVNAIVLNGANPGDFVLSNVPQLPATIPVGGAGIKFTLQFAPGTAGQRMANASISSDDPMSPRLLPISGTGTVGMTAVSPMMLDFGQVTELQTGGANFTLTNSGTGVVKVNTLSISGKDAALFGTKMKAPFNIAPMGSVVVQTTFSPTDIGMFVAQVDLTTDDMNLPTATVMLKGEGTAPGFAASPLSLDFGTVNIGATSMSQTVTLSNTGNQPLNIISVDLFGADSNDYAIGMQPAPMTMIAPNGKVTFTVSFTPSADAEERAQIDIMTNDPKNPSVSILLDGFGAQPMLQTAPPSLDFGMTQQVGTKSSPKSVTIQNTGDADLHISTIKIAGTTAGAFNCDSQGGFTLTMNQSMKVNVTFTPSAAMAYSGALVIDSSDSGVMSAMIPLSGTGVSPMIAASPTTIDFGPIPLGQSSASQTITIRNAGKSPVNLDKMTAADTQFGPPASGLNMLIPAGGSVDIQAAFAPTMTGDFKTQLQFWLNGATVPAVAVTVQGTGVMPGMRMDTGGCAVSGRARATALALPAVLLVLLGVALRRRRSR
jgi:hypothetical protein